MSKDDPENIKPSPEEQYLNRVKFYKSQAESLKNNAKQVLDDGKKPKGKSELKVTDKIKNIKNLVTASSGPNLALKNAVKEYVKKQPVDAAISLVDQGPKGVFRQAIDRPIHEKIDQQHSKAAAYSEIIKKLEPGAGREDPFAELRQKYGISSQSSSVKQNKPQNLPPSKGKNSAPER